MQVSRSSASVVASAVRAFTSLTMSSIVLYPMRARVLDMYRLLEAFEYICLSPDSLGGSAGEGKSGDDAFRRPISTSSVFLCVSKVCFHLFRLPRASRSSIYGLRCQDGRDVATIKAVHHV